MVGRETFWQTNVNGPTANILICIRLECTAEHWSSPPGHCEILLAGGRIVAPYVRLRTIVALYVRLGTIVVPSVRLEKLLLASGSQQGKYGPGSLGKYAPDSRTKYDFLCKHWSLEITPLYCLIAALIQENRANHRQRWQFVQKSCQTNSPPSFPSL